MNEIDWAATCFVCSKHRAEDDAEGGILYLDKLVYAGACPHHGRDRRLSGPSRAGAASPRRRARAPGRRRGEPDRVARQSAGRSAAGRAASRSRLFLRPRRGTRDGKDAGPPPRAPRPPLPGHATGVRGHGDHSLARCATGRPHRHACPRSQSSAPACSPVLRLPDPLGRTPGALRCPQQRNDDRRWVPPGGTAPNRRHDMANGS